MTMQQVADRAGVSISTVSFLVNDTKPVSPDTRERILRAIDELGYRRNAMARALASRRSRMLALLYPMLDRNLDLFVEAASRRAEDRGYQLVVWPVTADRTSSAVTALIDTGIAEGVILLEVQLEDERVRRLQEAEAPFVLIGRTRDVAGIDYVDIDFERSTAEAVEHLAGFGHEHLVLVVEDFADTVLAGYAPPVRVEDSFRAAVARLGLHGAVLSLARDVSSEVLLADRIANEQPETSGVIVMHSGALFALANGFRRRGIDVPADVSLVSLANSAALGALLDPPVTTWETPGTELGRSAADALIDRIERLSSGGLTQTLVACRRHDGASVARARAGRAPLDRIRS